MSPYEWIQVIALLAYVCLLAYMLKPELKYWIRERLQIIHYNLAVLRQIPEPDWYRAMNQQKVVDGD